MAIAAIPIPIPIPIQAEYELEATACHIDLNKSLYGFKRLLLIISLQAGIAVKPNYSLAKWRTNGELNLSFSSYDAPALYEILLPLPLPLPLPFNNL